MRIVKVEKIKEHCDIIYNWRNDLTTRNMSLNTNIIDYETFCSSFYNDYFKFYNPIFLQQDKKFIGYIRFTVKNSLTYINININPSFRNKKYGGKFINLAIIYLKDNYKKG